jgi:putative ABC transport system permease protein
MYWKMLLTQFLKDIRAQKLRSTLTILGIVWGTVSIVLLLAFGTGLEAQIKKRFHGLGEGIVITFPGKTSRPYAGFNRGRTISLREEDAELIRSQSKLVGRISPEYERYGVTVSRGENRVSGQISGVLPEFSEMRNLIADWGGRFINELDVRQKRRVAFIGDRLREDLFKGDQAVGGQILIAGTPFTVVGVMKPKEQDSDYSGRDNRKVTIPTSTFSALFSVKQVDYLIYQAKEPHMTNALMDDVFRILGRRHRFDPGDREALLMWDTTQMDQFADLFMAGFSIFIGVVGTFTLIVGGIGVSNIMNVVVEERTREIGVKMALGAKKKLIRGQFFLETFLITGTGGLVGFLISWGIAAIVPAFGWTEYIGDPTISPLVAVVAVTLLGTVGAVAGYGPARRASDMDPVQALRK